MAKKNLKISESVYETLSKAKKSKDTWDDFLSRTVNSATQDQVHVDRATLNDYGNWGTTELEFRASPEGSLELRFTDESGNSIGSVTLDSLAPNEEVRASVTAGERADNE